MKPAIYLLFFQYLPDHIINTFILQKSKKKISFLHGIKCNKNDRRQERAWNYVYLLVEGRWNLQITLANTQLLTLISWVTRDAGDPTVWKDSKNIKVVLSWWMWWSWKTIQVVLILTATFWFGEFTENRRCLGNDSEWNVGVFWVHTATLIFGAELDRLRPLDAGRCVCSSVSISFAAITVLKDNI